MPKTLFETKLAIDVKLVKLIFRLYFLKDIFKVLINLQYNRKKVEIIKIFGYKTINYNAVKQLNI